MSGRGRNHNSRYRGQNRNVTLSTVAKENVEALPTDSPILAMFKNACSKLNDRQDRHERLVKLSRDITIESKRIIFLLHSTIRKEDIEKTITEAADRLTKLIEGPIKSVGIELETRSAYLHTRATSPGFQEFVEAYTLWFLMKNKVLPTWTEVQDRMVYTVKGETEEAERQVTTLLTKSDYMLGIADLTGELMRMSINNISSGDADQCQYACQVVRDLYTGYLGLFGIGKELARKLGVTRANVAKVESAVYALKVRGGEYPPILCMTERGEERTDPDQDEGFYY